MTSPTPITKVEDLKAALQLAIGVELSTIPVYLTALYSIKDGRNPNAAQTIRSVVMEEMLHMTLAANVLNALGQVPSLQPVTFQGHQKLSPVSDYPLTSPLISGIGTLELLPLSPKALESFVRIEHPLHGAATLKSLPLGTCPYQTIGEFYQAIETALKDDKICPKTAFKPLNQVAGGEYYGGAGQVIEVKDRDTALKALNKIVDQGEGLPENSLKQQAKKVTTEDRLHATWTMYSHYARFRELQTGRRFRPQQLADETPQGAMLLVDYEAVHPAQYTKRSSDTTGGPEGAALVEFDLAYSQLVDDLYLAFAGKQKDVPSGLEANTKKPKPALPLAVHGMYALRQAAVALMRTPHPAHPAHTLCPRFSYVPLGDRDKQRTQAKTLRGQSQ